MNRSKAGTLNAKFPGKLKKAYQVLDTKLSN